MMFQEGSDCNQEALMVELLFAEAMVMMASASKSGMVKDIRKEERKTNGNKRTEQLSAHS
jgi:hypothetical protein